MTGLQAAIECGCVDPNDPEPTDAGRVEFHENEEVTRGEDR